MPPRFALLSHQLHRPSPALPSSQPAAAHLPCSWPLLQATSISPWIVTPHALEPFACAAPPQDDPQPLPYLRQQPDERTNYDIQLEVALQPAGGRGGGEAAGGSSSGQATVVTRSNLKTMYWTLPQVGGCLRQAAEWMPAPAACIIA